MTENLQHMLHDLCTAGGGENDPSHEPWFHVGQLVPGAAGRVRAIQDRIGFARHREELQDRFTGGHRGARHLQATERIQRIGAAEILVAIVQAIAVAIHQGIGRVIRVQIMRQLPIGGQAVAVRIDPLAGRKRSVLGAALKSGPTTAL